MIEENYFEGVKKKNYFEEANYFEEVGLNYLYNEDYKNAIKSFIHALDFSPDDTYILSLTGNTYIKIGDFDSAVKYLKKIINKDLKSDPFGYISRRHVIDKSHAYQEIAEAYNGKDKYDKAITACKKALELNPWLSNPWKEVSCSFKCMGEFKKAKEALKIFKKKEKKIRKIRIREDHLRPYFFLYKRTWGKIIFSLYKMGIKKFMKREKIFFEKSCNYKLGGFNFRIF